MEIETILEADRYGNFKAKLTKTNSIRVYYKNKYVRSINKKRIKEYIKFYQDFNLAMMELLRQTIYQKNFKYDEDDRASEVEADINEQEQHYFIKQVVEEFSDILNLDEKAYKYLIERCNNAISSIYEKYDELSEYDEV